MLSNARKEKYNYIYTDYNQLKRKGNQTIVAFKLCVHFLQQRDITQKKMFNCVSNGVPHSKSRNRRDKKQFN